DQQGHPHDKREVPTIQAKQFVEELRKGHRPEANRRRGGCHGPHHGGRRRRCLVVYAQFEQAQLPPHAQPPEVDALEASAEPTTAKVETTDLVWVIWRQGPS